MGLTTDGWDALTKQAGDTSAQPASFNYVAVGVGTTAFDAAQTTLVSETTTLGLGRAQGTFSHTDDTKIWTITKTFTSTGSITVTEAGLFNAASGGTMLARQTFTRSLVATDTLEVTFSIVGTNP